MTSPTPIAVLRAAVRRTWQRLRQRDGDACRHPTCDADVGPDFITCNRHDRLPESKQRFMRRSKSNLTSTEETP